MHHADEFGAAFVKSSVAAGERAQAAEGTSKNSKKKMGTCFVGTAFQRRLILWSVAQPRAKLAGLIIDLGGVVTSPCEVAAGLAKHWAQTFSKRDTDVDAMASLACFEPAFPQLLPPSRAMAASAIARSKNRAPGWDGVPAAGWRAISDTSAKLCWDSLLWLCAGRYFGASWHPALVVYLPKKLLPGEVFA